MVVSQLQNRGIYAPAVLAAMEEVPRHLFVPSALHTHAYDDCPLPIGYDQTISQPYIVALMTQAAHVTPQSRVLEIGTGSGYQAAILATLAKEVYTIEVVLPLAEQASALLASYPNVWTRAADGSLGWPEAAPFDIILATAAPTTIPKPLIDQLATNGRLIIPVGPQGNQQLICIHKDVQGNLSETFLEQVRFVPLISKHAPVL